MWRVNGKWRTVAARHPAIVLVLEWRRISRTRTRTITSTSFPRRRGASTTPLTARRIFARSEQTGRGNVTRGGEALHRDAADSFQNHGLARRARGRGVSGIAHWLAGFARRFVRSNRGCALPKKFPARTAPPAKTACIWVCGRVGAARGRRLEKLWDDWQLDC